METKALREAGLTEGEIKVYLALIELGSTTTGPLIEKSKVSRSIINEILKKLIQKGLTSYIVKEKTKYYEATRPQKILEYLDEKEKEMEKTKEEVKKLLPLLLMKKKGTPTSQAQIYEGFKGIQTVHEKTYDRLKKGESFYYFGIPPYQDEKYHLYWNRDHVRRVKAGIKCKLLFNIGTDRSTLKNRNSFKGCDARHMTVDIHTPAWFLGYKDTIVIGLQSEEIAIEIVNKKIADSFHSYFEEFWKKTKKFK